MVVKEMFGSSLTALFSAVFLSVNPIFLSVTTYGKQYGIELFFVLFSFYLMLHFHQRQSRLALFLSSMSMSFASMVRESAMLFVPFFFLLYLSPEIYFKQSPFFIKKISVRSYIFQLKNLSTLLIPFVIIFGGNFYYSFYHVLSKFYFKGGPAAPSFAGFKFPWLAVCINKLSFNLNPIGVIFALAGFFIIFKRDKNKFYFLFLVCWFLTFFVIADNILCKVRYLIVSLSPLFICVAYALKFIYRKSKFICITIFLALTLYSFLTIAPILSFRHNFCGPKDYALWLKTVVPENSIIIVIDDAPFVEYYSRLRPLKHPINDIEATQKWAADIKKYIRDGIPVYITETGFSYDKDRIVKDALVENFNLQLVGEHPNEHYQWTEIEPAPYMSRLWKLNLKRDV
jgi:hypothetical protein